MRIVVALVACLVGAVSPVLAQPAASPSAVVVSTPIALPAAANGFGVASPYPLSIPVTGIVGSAEVKVRLRGFAHTRPADVGIVLVSPTGVATFLMSDPVSGPVSGVDLEFENGAAPLPTPQIVSGTYRPGATFPNDFLPAPAPLGPYGTVLPSLTAAEANGTWRLFAADDFGGESGRIDGVDLIFTVTGGVNGSTLPDVGTAEFPVTIGVTGAIASVIPRLVLLHPATAAIDLWLVGPDGTTVELTSGNGAGAGYGAVVCTINTNNCFPQFTSFDDRALTPVTAGANPFIGFYRPEERLAAFEGKSGAAASGIWRLRVRDRVPGQVGALYRFELKVRDGGPLAASDAYGTPFQTPLTVSAPGVLINDDAQGAGWMRAFLGAGTANGVVSLAADGGFTYTPNAGFVGADRFTYRPMSSEGLGIEVEVSLTVANVTTAQPPSALRVHALAGSDVTLRWTPPAIGPAPTGYLLEGGTAPGQVAAAVTTGPVPVLTVRVPDGSLFVRVRAVASAGASGPSNELPLHVNVPVAPSAPAGLTGLVNGSTVTLAWRNTFAGGAPASLSLNVTGSMAAAVPLGLSESIAFENVPAGTYALALSALNAAGGSAPSNLVTVTVPGPCSGPPAIPTNLLVYRSGATVHALWDPPSAGAAAAGYVLGVSGSYVGSVAVTARTFSAPAPPGSYFVNVSALNACGAGPATAPQLVVVP